MHNPLCHRPPSSILRPRAVALLVALRAGHRTLQDLAAELSASQADLLSLVLDAGTVGAVVLLDCNMVGLTSDGGAWLQRHGL